MRRGSFPRQKRRSFQSNEEIHGHTACREWSRLGWVVMGRLGRRQLHRITARRWLSELTSNRLLPSRSLGHARCILGAGCTLELDGAVWGGKRLVRPHL